MSHSTMEKETLMSELNWITACEATSCVEVAQGDDGFVRVRSTQEPGIVALFTEEEWRQFLAGVKRGDFD